MRINVMSVTIDDQQRARRSCSEVTTAVFDDTRGHPIQIAAEKP